jgi:transcriptional regulator with XRE-family HTH domain
MNLGKALKTCRINKGWSLKQLSEKCDLSISYLSLLEKGNRDPNLSALNKICDAMNVPISIVIFLASDVHELNGLSIDVIEKLSATALNLIKEIPENV